MALTETLTKGFTCVCGKEHKFPPYVYAHWNVELVHTCELSDGGCGAKHWMRSGIVTLVQKRRKKRHDKGTSCTGC